MKFLELDGLKPYGFQIRCDRRAMCPICGQRPANDCGYGEFDYEGDFDCTHPMAELLECPCRECACDTCRSKPKSMFKAWLGWLLEYTIEQDGHLDRIYSETVNLEYRIGRV